MLRARRAVLAAFVLIWSLAALAMADPATPAAFAQPISNIPAAVGWPISNGLLIAEVVTGGASASDEYIELTNAGPAPVDLDGLEVAYASAAGTSAVRRATWTAAQLLGPGRHVLIANVAGIYAGQADVTYTAGMAAAGGAIVVRPVGGDPIDAVGWGDATNAFVESLPANAPDAGSSIERRPGGPGGNVIDTNDNAGDWSINPAPVPENLAAPARPAPGASSRPSPSASPSPTPSVSPSPSASPSPTPSASPSPSPSASPSPTPSASPSPSPSVSPRPSPSPSPSPSSSPRPSPSPTASPAPSPTPRPSPSPSPSAVPPPSPTPTASPTSSPSPSPSPTSITIAEALVRGGTVTVMGVATTGPNLIDGSGRLVVIQDASAAVEIRLPASGTSGAAGLVGHPVIPGARLEVSGTVGRAYGAPRVSASSVAWLGLAVPPAPLRIAAAPGAGLEWRLVEATGRFDSIHRLGQRWRAELVVGSARIPVAGLTGAQIAVGRLLAGRRVTVVGIARRAYPTAVDQRFVIEPRSVTDLAFDPARPAGTGGTSHGQDAGGGGGGGSGAANPPRTFAPAASAPTIDLADLASATGRTVRVAGLVAGVAGTTVSLDDGTTIGRLVLTGDAAPFLDLVQVGDPIEATGVVTTDPAGPYVLVTASTGVIQAGDPAPAGETGPATPAPAGGLPATSPRPGTANGSVDLVDPGAGPAPAAGLIGPAAGLLGVLLALSIALLLRRRGRRRGLPARPDETGHARATLGPS